MDASELSLAAAWRILGVAPGANWLVVKDAYHRALATSASAFHLALAHEAYVVIAAAGFPDRNGTPTHFDLGADKRAHMIHAMSRPRRR